MEYSKYVREWLGEKVSNEVEDVTLMPEYPFNAQKPPRHQNQNQTDLGQLKVSDAESDISISSTPSFNRKYSERGPDRSVALVDKEGKEEDPQLVFVQPSKKPRRRRKWGKSKGRRKPKAPETVEIPEPEPETTTSPPGSFKQRPIRKARRRGKSKMASIPIGNESYYCLNQLKFVKLGCAEIEEVTDEIQPGEIYKCLLRTNYGPGWFYINLGGYEQFHKLLMAHMQRVYSQLERFEAISKCAIPCKSHLTPGYYVAVKHPTKGKWYRAQILTILDDSYKVSFIDSGEIVHTRISNIRYLYDSFLRALKVQKVRCRAQLGSHYNDMKIRWTREDGEIFNHLINDQQIAIHFKQKTKIQGETVWDVVIHFLKDETNDEVNWHHVERQVLRISRGSYVVSPNEDTEINEELKCKIFNGISYS